MPPPKSAAKIRRELEKAEKERKKQEAAEAEKAKIESEKEEAETQEQLARLGVDDPNAQPQPSSEHISSRACMMLTEDRS